MGCCNDLFGVWSQTLQRHVLYISETYNVLMKNSIIGDLYNSTYCMATYCSCKEAGLAGFEEERQVSSRSDRQSGWLLSCFHKTFESLTFISF